ncbi:MAG: glycosyltransferase [Pseudomonadota bacterium]
MPSTASEPPRPRVLAIAEEANPEFVSVPLVGWSLAAALREVADVHLVTQTRNRDAIARAGLVEGRDFTAIDSEAVARPLYTLATRLRGGTAKGWTTMQAVTSLSYPYFEWLVWRRFREEIAAGRYDIVHRITPLSPTKPSLLAPRVGRAGVPFVLGPLNGGIPWPRGFEAARRAEREWLSYVRGAYRWQPGFGATFRHAAAVIAGSRHTAAELPADCLGRTVYIPENAIMPKRFALPPRAEPGLPLRATFVGRLVPYKGCDMVIEAAAPLLAAGQLVLDILGDGPEMPALRAQVATLGLEAAVVFHGWQRHEDVQGIIVGSDLFAFPSIREFGGAVVMEAMALGVAPLVADYGGPPEAVTEETGFKVAMGSRAEIVAGVRRALEALIADPEHLLAVGRAARARVHEKYTWSAKAEMVAAVYDRVLGRRPDWPRFFPEHAEEAAAGIDA